MRKITRERNIDCNILFGLLTMPSTHLAVHFYASPPKATSTKQHCQLFALVRHYLAASLSSAGTNSRRAGDVVLLAAPAGGDSYASHRSLSDPVRIFAPHRILHTNASPHPIVRPPRACCHLSRDKLACLYTGLFQQGCVTPGSEALRGKAWVRGLYARGNNPVMRFQQKLWFITSTEA